MFTRLKTTTALIVCSLFIVKLLFVSAALAAPVDGHISDISTTTALSVTDHHEQIAINVPSVAGNYISIDLCEEPSDDQEDLVKVNSPATTSSVETHFTSDISPRSNSSFDLIKCHLFPKKYLALSILRI